MIYKGRVSTHAMLFAGDKGIRIRCRKIRINSSVCARRHAFMISSSVASSFPHRRFSLIVPEKRTFSEGPQPHCPAGRPCHNPLPECPNPHLAPCDIIKPWYQCSKRRLCTSGSAEDTNGFSRSDMDIQVADDFFFGIGWVCKTHLFKINRAIRNIFYCMGNIEINPAPRSVPPKSAPPMPLT